jgi:hypothetical protein
MNNLFKMHYEIRNILGSFLDWFWLSIINGATVPILLFASVYFLPESPVFLLSKGRTEKARKALKWFRGAVSSDQIEPELQQVYNNYIRLNKYLTQDLYLFSCEEVLTRKKMLNCPQRNFSRLLSSNPI